jgi:hypothetical protein
MFLRVIMNVRCVAGIDIDSYILSFGFHVRANKRTWFAFFRCVDTFFVYG